MSSHLLTKQVITQLAQAYKEARSRLILLDYDGTLVAFAPTPEQAAPSRALLALLANVAHDPKNTIAIVSGRDMQSLEGWFGHLPLGLAAEHGHAVRPLGSIWQTAKDNGAWKTSARRYMQTAVDAAPGSFIEEKQSALCWHYRQVQPAVADALIPVLLSAVARDQLTAMQGNKVIEVRKTTITKAAALKYWTRPTDFLLIAGDDITDEAMFKAAPPEAITIKVGPGSTHARYRVHTPKDMVQFLDRLLEINHT